MVVKPSGAGVGFEDVKEEAEGDGRVVVINRVGKEGEEERGDEGAGLRGGRRGAKRSDELV